MPAAAAVGRSPSRPPFPHSSASPANMSEFSEFLALRRPNQAELKGEGDPSWGGGSWAGIPRHPDRLPPPPRGERRARPKVPCTRPKHSGAEGSPEMASFCALFSTRPGRHRTRDGGACLSRRFKPPLPHRLVDFRLAPTRPRAPRGPRCAPWPPSASPSRTPRRAAMWSRGCCWGQAPLCLSHVGLMGRPHSQLVCHIHDRSVLQVVGNVSIVLIILMYLVFVNVSKRSQIA